MITSYEGMDLKGIVLRIEKSSIYDGEGFRTVVFMKGCPLRCRWCSTPESQQMQIQKTLKGDITYGSIMTVEETMEEIRKDMLFYFHSKGGVTISGGEPLSQPEFVRHILRQSQREGIDTCIETTFYNKWETVREIIKYLSTVFVDIKFIDSKRHYLYCGVYNERILENLKKTNEIDEDFGLIIRIPLIPGCNDTEEELTGIARFSSRLKKLKYVQLLPYHRLGTDTYRKLGIPYTMSDIHVPSKEHLENCKNIIREYVHNVI